MPRLLLVTRGVSLILITLMILRNGGRVWDSTAIGTRNTTIPLIKEEALIELIFRDDLIVSVLRAMASICSERLR